MKLQYCVKKGHFQVIFDISCVKNIAQGWIGLFKAHDTYFSYVNRLLVTLFLLSRLHDNIGDRTASKPYQNIRMLIM